MKATTTISATTTTAATTTPTMRATEEPDAASSINSIQTTSMTQLTGSLPWVWKVDNQVIIITEFRVRTQFITLLFSHRVAIKLLF